MNRTSQNKRAPASRVLWALAAATPLVLGGCGGGGGQTRSDPSPELQREGRAVLNDDRGPTRPARSGRDQAQPVGVASGAPAGDSSWTIVLARPTSSEAGAAQRLLDDVRAFGGVPEARLETRRGRPVVVYGRYPSPDDDRAKRDLENLRAKQVDGKPIFAMAFLAPPSDGALMGSNAVWDLRTVRQRFGEDALYTLQVGVYTRLDGRSPTTEDLAQFRAAAEQAVAGLRAEGEQAFYHHGPGASTVTVGVFGESDHDPAGGFESPRLAEARERHPNNLVNGQGYNETLRTDTGRSIRRLQRSQLVAIPAR